MKRIGLLTSGGDAPGMNAAIRSVVRVATAQGCEVMGVRRGYEGLIRSDLVPLGARDVSNIIQRGGTVLKTARCEAFKTPDGLQRAKHALESHGMDGLIVIGGDGSFRGALELGELWPGRMVGVPGTIDNDLYGSDFTIGFDTAVNTALDAIDKIRDTAESHDQFFLIEVMGRHSGFIAMHAGIGAGAEEVIVPEEPFDLDAVCRRLQLARDRGKTSTIVVVAEGGETGGAIAVARRLKDRIKRDYRVTILGHVQRGGVPTALDRLLATKLSAFAVELLLKDQGGVMAGEVAGALVATPFKETWTRQKPVDPYLFEIHSHLSI